MEEDKKIELFGQFRKDPKLKEALEKTGLPNDPEGTVKLLAGLAKEFGYALSEEDLLAVILTAEKRRKTATQKSVEEIERLPDNDLERVAGGYSHIVCWEIYKENDICQDTYMDMENCWQTDGCDQHYIMYPDYHCVCNEKSGYEPECGTLQAAHYCLSVLF